MYTDYDIGQSLVTEELLRSVRDLLSSALPKDASDDMTQGFWDAVYVYL